eukprot:scaffold43648_cov21-Tisochrysis_lutea.AAC.2
MRAKIYEEAVPAQRQQVCVCLSYAPRSWKPYRPERQQRAVQPFAASAMMQAQRAELWCLWAVGSRGVSACTCTRKGSCMNGCNGNGGGCATMSLEA